MADGFLTATDVYDPAKNVMQLIQAMNAKEQLDQSRYKNRLMEEYLSNEAATQRILTQDPFGGQAMGRPQAAPAAAPQAPQAPQVSPQTHLAQSTGMPQQIQSTPPQPDEVDRTQMEQGQRVQQKANNYRQVYDRILATKNMDALKNFVNHVKRDPDVGKFIPDDLKFIMGDDDKLKMTFTKDYDEGELKSPSGDPLPKGNYTTSYVDNVLTEIKSNKPTKLSPQQELAKNAIEEKKKARGDNSPASANEIQDEIARQQERGFAKRYETLVKGRQVSPQYDKTTGTVVAGLTQGDWEKNKGNYVSVQDANYKALVDQTKRYQSTKQLTNTLDNYVKETQSLMKRYGFNTGGRLYNVPANKVKQLMGSGEYQSVVNYITGIQNDLGRIESANLGNAGTTVEAMRQFNLDKDMPMSEFFKMFENALNASYLRKKALQDAVTDIHRQLGYKGDPKKLFVNPLMVYTEDDLKDLSTLELQNLQRESTLLQQQQQQQESGGGEE